jgi:starvation-inducible DNA-binding protein
MKQSATQIEDLERRQRAPLATPTDLKAAATRDIAGAMNAILADVFALHLKTKNFHWHMSGPHFRDYHLLLDEQANAIFAMLDNDADYVQPLDMLAELREDNKMLASRLREAHELCEEHRDVATASLIEIWIEEAERRTWFLFEASRQGDAGA